MKLNEYLPELPIDYEGPQRAIEYQRFLREASSSKNKLEKVVLLYRKMGTGEIQLSSYHDEIMVIYSLSKAPFLVRHVRNDVNELLKQIRWKPSESLWRWVLAVCTDYVQQNSRLRFNNHLENHGYSAQLQQSEEIRPAN